MGMRLRFRLEGVGGRAVLIMVQSLKRPTADDVMEAEANAFAMELLMPAAWLMEDIRKMGGIDIEDDKKITTLARRYKVSPSVMALRLGQLAYYI